MQSRSTLSTQLIRYSNLKQTQPNTLLAFLFYFHNVWRAFMCSFIYLLFIFVLWLDISCKAPVQTCFTSATYVKIYWLAWICTIWLHPVLHNLDKYLFIYRF